MHELALAQALVKLAVDSLGKEPEQRIVSLSIEIGSLSGVNEDALTFCIPISADGTPAQGCEVHISHTPGRARCLNCAQTYDLAEWFEPCPHCGGVSREILDGKQFRLTSMEVS